MKSQGETADKVPEQNSGFHKIVKGPALGEKMAGLICKGEVEDLPQEDIELARFSREWDPNRVQDTIALPFPKE